MHCLAVVLVAALIAPASHAQTPSQDELRFVDSIRTSQRLPALAVIVVRSDGEPLIVVTGERKFGGRDSLRATDRMHLGSNGKAITATLIGVLVEQGRLTFETTVADVFPELAATMRPEYRGVTVRQLMGHAAGVRPYTDLREFGSFMRSSGPAMEQRKLFVARLLSEKPLFPPGTKHVYSNAGVALAGIMTERLTGRSYEALVDSLVFRPLGGRARFGNPGTDSVAQPFGHVRSRGGVKIIDPRDRDYVVPQVITAAGDASVTLEDYGRFLQQHLRGLRGVDGLLKAATVRELHTPIAPVDTSAGYAAGWGVVIRDGVETHGHSGSGGAYIAITAIQPTRDFAVAFLTNIGGDDVMADFSKLRPVLTAKFWPSKASIAR